MSTIDKRQPARRSSADVVLRPARSSSPRASLPSRRSRRPRRCRRRPLVATRASISASSPTARSFIVTHRSEMGTGIRTALPMVAADELDADWAASRSSRASATRSTAIQNTDGSRSIRDFYDALRVAGASGAHRCSSSAAAAQWGVPESRVHGAEPRRGHTPSGRKLGYGALVPPAAKLPVPKGEDAEVQAERRSTASSARTCRRSTDLDIVDRQGAVRHRRAHAGHGVRIDRATRRCSAARSRASTTRRRRR